MTYRRTRKRRTTTRSSDESLARYIGIRRRFSCYLLDGQDDARPSDTDIAWMRWYMENFYTDGAKEGQKIEKTKRTGDLSNVTRIRGRMVPRT